MRGTAAAPASKVIRCLVDSDRLYCAPPYNVLNVRGWELGMSITNQI